MSRYAQFGHRSVHSDGLSASDPDRGCCLMALQFRKHLSSTVSASASSSRSAAPRSILSQTMHCKLAKRALYVTVTHGTSTTLWRFDWPQIARRQRTEASQDSTLVLVARIVWAAADTSGKGKKKSTPTVERAGTVTSVDALLPGGGGFMKGDRVRQFTSSCGMLTRWKAYAYGLGARRFLATASAESWAARVASVQATSGNTLAPGAAPSALSPTPPTHLPTAIPAQSTTSSASILRRFGSSLWLTLAELFPPDPGVIKPSLTIYSPADSPSNSPTTLFLSLDPSNQTLCDDLVLTSLLLVARPDEYRSVQSPTLDDIVRHELAAAPALSISRHGAARTSTATLPAYASTSSLPEYTPP